MIPLQSCFLENINIALHKTNLIIKLLRRVKEYCVGVNKNTSNYKFWSVSTRIIESSDHYLTKVISYIGERVTSKTDEINWQFQ